MQQFLHRTRYAALLLVGCLALELLPWRAARAGEPARVDNIRVERAPSRMTIIYDLAGENDEKYTVTLTMKRRSRPELNYAPKNVTGDIGEEIEAGKDRRIVWEYGAEFPRGLASGDVYFDVQAGSVSSGISPLVWIGGGVAVAGVAALLLLKKSGGTSSQPAGISVFPDEPARPK